MHELGLLSGVVSAAESSIPSGKNRRFLRIALRVGARSGAIPEALEGAWPIASSGSVCDGAELLIDFVPATVWCPQCDGEVEIDEFFALCCPVCGTPTADLRSGREFEIAWVDIEDPKDEEP